MRFNDSSIPFGGSGHGTQSVRQRERAKRLESRLQETLSIQQVEREAHRREERLHALTARRLASSNAELRQSNSSREAVMAQLRASNAELERFAFVCSHDMKEPIRTISGLLDFLVNDEDRLSPAERRDLKNRIDRDVARLNSIIESLLAYSRLNSRVETVLLDLNAIVSDVLEGLDHEVKAADAEIELGDLPKLTAADIHMRQLFQNLISNGLKFRRRNKVCKIRVAANEKSDSWVISVEDSGRGVPKKDRERIFSMFQRLNSKDNVEGTGLGLSICSRIVSQYGGVIVCRDSFLGGAAFDIHFPKVVG